MGRNAHIAFYIVSFLGIVVSLFSIIYDVLIIGWYFEDHFDAVELIHSVVTLFLCMYLLLLLKKNNS